jgi:hypothetical protein
MRMSERTLGIEKRFMADCRVVLRKKEKNNSLCPFGVPYKIRLANLVAI